MDVFLQPGEPARRETRPADVDARETVDHSVVDAERDRVPSRDEEGPGSRNLRAAWSPPRSAPTPAAPTPAISSSPPLLLPGGLSLAALFRVPYLSKLLLEPREEPLPLHEGSATTCPPPRGVRLAQEREAVEAGPSD